MAVIKNTVTASFSSFGHSFQEGFVSLILHNRSFSDQIKEVLEIDYLELKAHKIIVQKIFEHKEKYGEHPTVSTVKAILNTDLQKENSTLKTQVLESFDKISSSSVVENSEFIKERTLDFCKKEKLRSAMLKSIDFLEKCSFDEIKTEIDAALKLGLDNNLGHRYVEDFEDRFKIKHRGPVTTGWDFIDKITGGGMGKGELTVVIGGTGSGKSHMLVHLGAQALKAGKNVIYYTLELAANHIGNRFDSCLTGIPLDELHKCKDAIHETVKNIEGKLIIKEYPCKSVSIEGIRNHLEKLRQRNFLPNLIIIDYCDLLKSNSNYKEKRWDLESIFEETRALAQQFECAALTASQSNRQGFGSELLSLESIAESFAKTFVSDLIITLSRTREDKISNTARIYIAKNRNGVDGIVFPAFFDPSTVTIKVLAPEEISDSNLSAEEKQAKEAQKLKDSYKKYINGNSKNP